MLDKIKAKLLKEMIQTFEPDIEIEIKPVEYHGKKWMGVLIREKEKKK